MPALPIAERTWPKGCSASIRIWSGVDHRSLVESSYSRSNAAPFALPNDESDRGKIYLIFFFLEKLGPGLPIAGQCSIVSLEHVVARMHTRRRASAGGQRGLAGGGHSELPAEAMRSV